MSPQRVCFATYMKKPYPRKGFHAAVSILKSKFLKLECKIRHKFEYFRKRKQQKTETYTEKPAPLQLTTSTKTWKLKK